MGQGRKNKMHKNTGRKTKNTDKRNTQNPRNRPEEKTVGYARVSSHTQKDDLQRQIEAIKNYAEKIWGGK